MAISLQETLPNGVPLSYHRIVSLTTVVNQQCIIEVASYVNQEAREQELPRRVACRRVRSIACSG